MLEIRPELRILVCSGSPFFIENLPDSLHRQVAFLQKPFMPKMLADAVQQLMAQQSNQRLADSQQRLMQLLGEIFAGLRPQQARLHRQRVVQIVHQFEQALDVELDHARAIRQLRLRKKTSVDAKLNFERAVRGDPEIR